MTKLKNTRLVLLVIGITLLSAAATASAQDFTVNLILNNPSPYLSEWQSRRNTAIIFATNNTGTSRQVKILARIKLNGEEVAYTKTESILPRSFPAGMTTYNGEDLVPLIAVHFNSNIDQNSQRMGRIPDGLLCVTVIIADATTGEELARDEACAALITYTTPILILPNDNVELCRQGQNNVIDKSSGQPRPMFTWTPVVPQPNFPVTYRFAVYEVVPGMEPIAAFRGGRAVFTRDLVAITQLLWPTEYFMPESGKRYMWSVRALNEKGSPIVKSYDGWSEPHYFTVVKDCNDGTGVDIDGDGIVDRDVFGNDLRGVDGKSRDGRLQVAITLPFDGAVIDNTVPVNVNGTAIASDNPVTFQWFVRSGSSAIFTQMTPPITSGSPATSFSLPELMPGDDNYVVRLTAQSALGSVAFANHVLNVANVGSSEPIFDARVDGITGLKTYLLRLYGKHPSANIFLMMNGKSVGQLSKIEVGQMDGVTDLQKSERGAEYVILKFGAGLERPLYNWIEVFLSDPSLRQDMSIIAHDREGKELSRMNFYNSFITQVVFPALDAMAKDASSLISLGFLPEQFLVTRADSGKEHPEIKHAIDNTSNQEFWSPANFTFSIDGISPALMAKVSKVDAITIKQSAKSESGGQSRDYIREPGKIDFPNLKFTVPDLDPIEAEQINPDDVNQPAGAHKHKGGSLVYLNRVRQRVLTLTLENMSILKTSSTSGAHSTSERSGTVELQIEGIKAKFN